MMREGQVQPEVQVLQESVTGAAEVRKIASVRLLIVYRDGEGNATVPVERGSRFPLHPSLTQTWTWKSFLSVFMFFAAAWGCLLGLAILVVSTQRSLGDRFRYYAVLVVVLTWIGGILGLPDLAKIPVQPFLRRLYSSTHPHRVSISLIFLLCALAISVLAGRIVYCLIVRQRYASLIEQALNEDQRAANTIKKAFVLQPWRREAQALFELSAYKVRRPSYAYSATQPEFMQPFREYVSLFLKDPQVQNSVEKALASPKPSCCLKPQAESTSSDPVIWYASILPESVNDDSGASTSIAYLSKYAGNNRSEAKLIQLSLQLYLDRNDEDRAVADASALSATLNGAAQKGGESTFAFQFAADYLGSHYVRFCNFQSAYEWFNREINARDLQPQYRFRADVPLWQRPPQKLILPYMFLLYGPMKDQDVATDNYFRKAQRLLDSYALPCDPSFRKEFETKLLDYYPGFKQWDAWLNGTLLDPKIKVDQYIRQSLDEGWRY